MAPNSFHNVDTFTRSVKVEMIERLLSNRAAWPDFLSFTLATTARFSRHEIVIGTTLEAYASLLQTMCIEIYGEELEIRRNKNKITLDFALLGIATTLRKQSRNYELKFPELLNDTEIDGDGELLPEFGASGFASQWRETMLQAIFLAAGVVDDPAQSYHLEFYCRKRSMKTQIGRLLDWCGVAWRNNERAGGMQLSLKGGQATADFLALSGAHKALLKYENDRIYRSLNNNVNRAVNCDYANSNRLAITAVKQLNAITKLRQTGEINKLAAPLREAADLREKYPGFSLKELGELCDPPVGKSGIYHRMNLLLQKAAQIEPES